MTLLTLLESAVRREDADLTLRQLAILLIVYMHQQPHTVRSLSEGLGISKPAVSRALDRLGQLGLARRQRDSKDRRVVLVERTTKGSALLNELGDQLIEPQRNAS